MAKATIENVTEVVREDVTLTMTRDEAEKILSLTGNTVAGTLHGVHNALRVAGIASMQYRVADYHGKSVGALTLEKKA